MSRFDRAAPATDAHKRPDCPCWCITKHDTARGEDDWVHEGVPLDVEDGILARLCMSVDPGTGAVDGPYVVVGARELTVAEAEALGVSFIGLAVAGSAFSRPAAGGTHSLDR
ncbi:DUF6907 domain-containing protein [Mycetocola sp.]|uniref:DUF6907 domain-containing protein n=1 Tax=Mycetocola sp. TaxID=1871042 RepID=UPI0039892B32